MHCDITLELPTSMQNAGRDYTVYEPIAGKLMNPGDNKGSWSLTPGLCEGFEIGFGIDWTSDAEILCITYQQQALCLMGISSWMWSTLNLMECYLAQAGVRWKQDLNAGSTQHDTLMHWWNPYALIIWSSTPHHDLFVDDSWLIMEVEWDCPKLR